MDPTERVPPGGAHSIVSPLTPGPDEAGLSICVFFPLTTQAKAAIHEATWLLLFSLAADRTVGSAGSC